MQHGSYVDSLIQNYLANSKFSERLQYMYRNSFTFPGNHHCDSLHYYFDTMIFSKYHESAHKSIEIIM